MNEKLSLIASVSVIALVLYGVWFMSEFDRSELTQLSTTIKTLNDTLGRSPVTVRDENEKMILYAGAAILLIATLYTLTKKGK